MIVLVTHCGALLLKASTMNRNILHHTIRQFRHSFQADFSRLTQQDLCTILSGPSETLLTVLHERYGYTPLQAIQAWNEFVLRRVNGPATNGLAAECVQVG